MRTALPLLPFVLLGVACTGGGSIGSIDPDDASAHPDAGGGRPDSGGEPPDAGGGGRDGSTPPSGDGGNKLPDSSTDSHSLDAPQVETGPGTDGSVMTDCPATEGTAGTVLASGQPEALQQLAIDANNVYWTSFWSTGSTPSGDHLLPDPVAMVPKAGGTTVTLATDQYGLGGIVSDGTSVYWGSESSDGETLMIMTEPVSGGSPALFWSAPNTSGDQLFRVASDGSSLFWSIQGITSAPLGGGTATSLTSSLSAGPFVAVDASNVYWVELLGPVAGSQVWSVPKEGGTATSLWSESESIVVAIAADATGIYFVNQGNLVVVDGGDSVPAPNTGSILMIPSGGGAATTLVSGLNYPNSVAVDGTNVYWTDFTGVSKAPIGGGATTVLAAEGGPGAISVEVDGSDAYWLNECFGTVKKIAK